MDVETGAGGKHELDLGNITEDIIAEVGDTYDLGSEDKNWAYLWVAIAMVTSITIGGIIGLSNVDSVLFINASTQVNGSLYVDTNISAINITASGYYFGNGSQLTDISVTESDPYWTGNQSSYYLKSNPFGFYNSTDFSIANYYLKSNPYGFYNSTDFSIANYYLKSNPFGFYNSTNPSPETKWNANYSTFLTHINWSQAVNGTLFTTALYNTNYTANDAAYRNRTNTSYYLATNPYAFWNSTFAQFNKTYADTLYSTIAEPKWTGNWTNVAFINKANAFNAFNQSFDTNVLFIDAVSNRVGIGLTAPKTALEVTGNITLTSANNCIIFDSGGKICSGA